MSFDSIAKEIVRDSIRSAVCVDNAFVEPYAEKHAGDDEKTPQKLLESFRKENCSMNICRYDKSNWKEVKDFVLSNRDLLILDWELIGDPPFKDALEILHEVVNSPSLPFVVIYTQESDLSIVEMNILSFFGPPFASIAERKNKYDEICEKLEDESELDDPNSLFRTLRSDCKEFVLREQKRSEIRKTIVESIRTFVNNENFRSVMKDIIKVGKEILRVRDLDDFLQFLGFYYENTMVNINNNPVSLFRILGTRHSFIINSTLISIFVKKEIAKTEGESAISPEEVYTRFAEGIYKRPNNFLALLVMEMKTLYKENSAIIGRELYDIDELAFFYYQKNLKTEDDFYDFLRNCWKNQISSFNVIQHPKLFSILDEYKTKYNIEEKIEECKQNELEYLKTELVKLNFQYSFVQSERKEDDIIRFGDLFFLSVKKEKKRKIGFLLCITPNCDCLHFDNIKNKFYFVFGHDNTSIKEGLESAEKGCYSFIVLDEKPICIQWSRKPFTLYIPPEKNSITNPIQVEYHGSEHFLEYIASQKENYTQRIANAAFSHASRVGVELASLKET